MLNKSIYGIVRQDTWILFTKKVFSKFDVFLTYDVIFGPNWRYFGHFRPFWPGSWHFDPINFIFSTKNIYEVAQHDDKMHFEKNFGHNCPLICNMTSFLDQIDLILTILSQFGQLISYSCNVTSLIPSKSIYETVHYDIYAILKTKDYCYHYFMHIWPYFGLF